MPTGTAGRHCAPSGATGSDSSEGGRPISVAMAFSNWRPGEPHRDGLGLGGLHLRLRGDHVRAGGDAGSVLVLGDRQRAS